MAAASSLKNKWVAKTSAPARQARLRMAWAEGGTVRGRMLLAWVRPLLSPAEVECRFLEKKSSDESEPRPEGFEAASRARVVGHSGSGVRP